MMIMVVLFWFSLIIISYLCIVIVDIFFLHFIGHLESKNTIYPTPRLNFPSYFAKSPTTKNF